MIGYQYFMDDMKDWELELLLGNINYSHRNEWEMTRMIMYSAMAPYMKKGSNKSPKDILPLPTDDDYKATEDVERDISDSQIHRMRNISAQISKNINKKDNG